MSKSIDKHFEQVQKHSELVDRVQNCSDNGDELNDWEGDFLESLKGQLVEGKKPSTSQMEKLEQIEYVVEWGRSAYWDEFGQVWE